MLTAHLFKSKRMGGVDFYTFNLFINDFSFCLQSDSLNHYSVVKTQMESKNFIYGICTGEVNLAPRPLVMALRCLLEGFL